MSDEQERSTLEIIEAHKSGTFLGYVSKPHGGQLGREQLGEVLISLHNSGPIDVISEFMNLGNR